MTTHSLQKWFGGGGGGGGDVIPGETQLIRVPFTQAEVRGLLSSCKQLLPPAGDETAYAITRAFLHLETEELRNAADNTRQATQLTIVARSGNNDWPLGWFGSTDDLSALPGPKSRAVDYYTMGTANFFDTDYNAFTYFAALGNYRLVENAAVWFGLMPVPGATPITLENLSTWVGTFEIELAYATISVPHLDDDLDRDVN